MDENTAKSIDMVNQISKMAKLIDDAEVELAKNNKRLQETRLLLSDLEAQQRILIYGLLDANVSKSRIARVAGISPQRVGQICDRRHNSVVSPEKPSD